jgi:hypothetical protein
MDKSKFALGAGDMGNDTCLALDPGKLAADERILILEQQMMHMQRVLAKLRKENHGTKTPKLALPPGNMNKDGLPIGTVCFGATEKSPFLQYLTIEADGYVVGSVLYPSLSAAAEAMSGVRRSGWTYWKLVDGRTLKEAFKV